MLKMLIGPYFMPILQVTLCSQTCLVRCYFFNLLNGWLFQQVNEQKRTEKETQTLKIIKKSYIDEFFFIRMPDLAFIWHDRVCCCNSGEPYFNHSFYEEQSSSQKRLVLGYQLDGR